MLPSIEIFGIERHGLAEKTQGFAVATLLLAQVTQQVGRLGSDRSALHQIGENPLGHHLRVAVGEDALAAEAVALDAAETLWHQLVGPAIVLERLVAQTQP